jgi:hypothetical protein
VAARAFEPIEEQRWEPATFGSGGHRKFDDARIHLS